LQRLVAVSNRVGPIRESARAGGLAVALVDALREHGGLWFGWSGDIAEETGVPAVQTFPPLTLATCDLGQQDYDEFYLGFANRALWPLLHYRIDLTSFDRQDFQGYLRVNRKLADGLVPLLEPDDLVWVHDYHFLPFGEELRRRGCRQRLGYFLHTPFPAPEVLTTLPVHDSLVRALFAYDLIGFQTPGDRNCFVHYVEQELGGEILSGDRVRAFGRTVRAAVFPIGIDTDNFVGFATAPDAQRVLDRLGSVLLDGRKLIIGVDRLDYSKGLPQRFDAFHRLLEQFPDNRRRVTFMQIAPHSRSDVEEYVNIQRELETSAGHINGQFGEYDWTPLRYLNRSFSRRTLAALYRASKVGLVTPLRDGMNLVAKEYVAAQDPDDPGVLVLSRFAGAASQLTWALIVNPYDTDGMAEALQTALHMPLSERQDRWSHMMERLKVEDVEAWRTAYLAALSAVPGDA
jgi:trehalose 6-phosphate synthase